MPTRKKNPFNDEIGIKFSWINFDGSFKNLILPISDPESRIKTSDEAVDNPQKNKGNYLESIKFNIIKKTDKKDEDGNPTYCFGSLR